ncbi:MAG: ATP-dependent zinc metalloprotease FtsH [Sandaracinaceae bacterium]|nr:ATP-dependent zinc metalloprotease FtsH [Sandaracinaceae bacterium]MDW8247271.1 ATP-dependent zinc metalloprotease FtsH [Sandaracinaceae bacterium]
MRQSHKTLLLWLLLIVMMVAIYQLVEPGDGPREVAYSQFVSDVRQGRVESVTVTPGAGNSAVFEYVRVDGDRRERCSSEGVVTDDLTRELIDRNVVVSYRANEGMSLTSVAIWTSLLPLVVLVVLFFLFMRQMQASGGKAMSFGKSRARLITESQNKVTFADVAGIDEAKDECEEIIAFLKDPKKFQRLGGRIPKGVLLMGAPGTGKTLLAKAIAGEAGVPFFSISGSDFVEMFVGVGASRVRDLFEQGKKHAPCIIFIDEIDAVGRHRGSGLGGGHDEREQTLNQLLVEMDGFESTDGVIIIAATNRPDVLDPALLRPGRFDRRIVVPRPDVNGRLAILQVHTRKVPLADDVDLEVIARSTPGMSGADLENLVNEAALIAARQDKDCVSMIDFELAKDKVRMGTERRSMIIPEKERRTTAYHEAGHALVGWLLPHHDPIHKVTIIPRGPALGLTYVLPKEDVLGRTKEQLEAMIAMALGGRVAEEIKFGEKTSGAANDLQRAAQIARAMITQLGMSDRFGPVVFSDREEDLFGMGPSFRHREYSEQTAREIDEEVRRIVHVQYERAKQLILENIDKLEAIALALLERETLDAEELRAIMDGRELPPRKRVVIPRYSEKANKAKERKKTSIFQPRPRELPSGT